MPPEADLLVSLRGVVKDHQALRPLRIERLELRAGQSIALTGFDAAMAEVLVNLITGASVPDSGEVVCFGLATTEIGSTEGWLESLDQFGLVSERAVLVDQLTAEQSLAMPLSLDFHDLPQPVVTATRALAEEVGLSPVELGQRVGELSPEARARIRLGRALALTPRVLLSEHPNALVSPEHTPALAAAMARIIGARRLAALTISADRDFAAAVTGEVFTLEPATGALKPATGWRRWFS